MAHLLSALPMTSDIAHHIDHSHVHSGFWQGHDGSGCLHPPHNYPSPNHSSHGYDGSGINPYYHYSLPNHPLSTTTNVPNTTDPNHRPYYLGTGPNGHNCYGGLQIPGIYGYVPNANHTGTWVW